MIEAKTSIIDANIFPTLLKHPKFSAMISNRALSGNRHSRSVHLKFCPSWTRVPSTEMKSGGQWWITPRPSQAFHRSISTVSWFTLRQFTSPCCCSLFVTLALRRRGKKRQEINCSFISLSIVLEKKENRPSWIPTWVSQHSSNDRRWLMKSRHREFLYDDCHRCGRSSSDANGRKKRREAQCTESKYCYQVVLRIANWRRTYEIKKKQKGRQNKCYFPSFPL